MKVRLGSIGFIAALGMAFGLTACTEDRSDEEPSIDLTVLAMIQLCRPEDSGLSGDERCALTPVPEGHVTIKANGLLVWEGPLERDGTVEAAFDSATPWHIEVTSPILEEPIVSEDFEPTGTHVMSCTLHSPTLELAE